MKKFVAIGLFMLGWAITAQAQQVQTRADRDSIRYGEQIRYEIRVQTDTLHPVSFPPGNLFAPFETVEEKPVDTSATKPLLSLTKQYLLTAWDTGHYVIPSVPVKIGDSIFQTDSMAVRVSGVQVDTTKQGLYDFKPVIPISHKPRISVDNRTPSPLWIFLALITAGVVFYWLYKRKKQQAGKHTWPSPFEKAMSKWEELYRSKQNISTGELYVELTDLLREYLEESLQIPAQESITPRLLELLHDYTFENGRKIPAENLQSLHETLKRADLAKFAKLKPYPPEQEQDFQTVKTFISSIQSVLDEIRAEKEREEKIRREQERRQKRKKRIITAGILAILILGGGWYIYSHWKHQIRDAYENAGMKLAGIPAEKNWFKVSYGSVPSISFKTPFVPQADATYEPSPELKPLLEEYAFLSAQGAGIRENVFIWDAKKNLDANKLKSFLENALKDTYDTIKLDLKDNLITGTAQKEDKNYRVQGAVVSGGNKYRILLLIYRANPLREELAAKILMSVTTGEEKETQ